MSRDSEIRAMSDLVRLHEVNARVARAELRIEKERAEESRRIFRDSIWEIENVIRREEEQEKSCRRRLSAMTESLGI